MPRYRYQLRTQASQVLAGECEAAHEQEARAQLAMQGKVLEIQELPPAEGSVPSTLSGGPAGVEGRDWTRLLPESGLLESARQAAGLAAAGLPLSSGLRAWGDETASRRLRGILHRIARRLDQGQSLSASFAQERRVPSALVSLLQVGELTGRLDRFVLTYGDHLQTMRWLQIRLVGAWLYPLLMLCTVLILVLLSLSGFLHETILGLFSGFGMSTSHDGMGWYTEIAISIINLTWKFRWGLGVLIALVALGAQVTWFSPFREQVLQGISWIIPPLGRWIAARNSICFCRLLADQVELGIPLPQALPLAGNATGSRGFGQAAAALAVAATCGEDLGKAAVYEKGLPLPVAQAFRGAHDRTLFMGCLRSCARLLEQQEQQRGGSLWFEPLIKWSFLGVTALFILLGYAGLIVPLISILNDLS